MSKNTGKIAGFVVATNSLYESDGLSSNTIDIGETARPKSTVVVLPDRDFVFHNFEIQRDLTREQLAETVEIRMFQDAGLNPMLEYKNSFACRDSKQDDRMKAVNAVAVSYGAIESATEKLKAKISYIDAILPTSTLPYALYNAEILEKKRDVFIYFQKEALVVSIFDNGEFVYGKTQDNGLRKLLESYAILSGKRVEFDDFVKILLTIDELDGEEDRQLLIDIREVLSSSLLGIKNILLYASRVSGLNEFDRIIIGSTIGTISGLDLLAQELFEIETHEFNFYTDFYTKGSAYMDQVALLALLEANNIANELPANPYNCTIYRRPGAFLTRKGGKILAFMSAAVFVVLLLPAYYQAQIFYYDYRASHALEEIGKSKAEFEANAMQRDLLIKEREDLNKQLQDATDQYGFAKAQLDEIHKRRTINKPVATNLAAIFADIESANLQITALDLKSRELNLKLISDQDTKITALLNTLVDKGYITSLNIITQDDKKLYEAELKVRLK